MTVKNIIRNNGRIHITGLLSGICLIIYAFGFFMPWYKDVSGIDVLTGFKAVLIHLNVVKFVLNSPLEFTKWLYNSFFLISCSFALSFIIGFVTIIFRKSWSNIVNLVVSAFNLFVFIRLIMFVYNFSHLFPSFLSKAFNTIVSVSLSIFFSKAETGILLMLLMIIMAFICSSTAVILMILRKF